MQTFYIDIYFLINFTVDALAMYFAAYLTKIPTSTIRILISALLGAATAVICYFLYDFPAASLVVAFVGLILICITGARRISVRRRLKLGFAFVLFLALVGGVAHLLWKLIGGIFNAGTTIDNIGVNRKLLVLSIVVLISIGVFRMFISLFSSNGTERSVRIIIRFIDKSVSTEALVDSGNLAIDPMDMRPVLLIKKDVARCIFPENVINLSDPDSLDRNVRRRIRLVPISRGGETHVLTGVRPDGVSVIDNGAECAIAVTVAIDKEGGDYGGYSALMPSAALEDI